MTASPLSTITDTNETPQWISAAAAKVIRSVISDLLESCGITDNVRLSWQREQSALKRKLPARSLTHQPGSQFNTPHSTMLAAVGKDPRNDICSIILSMPVEATERFRQTFASNITWTARQEAKAKPGAKEAPTDAPEPGFDETSIILYLDGLRECGSLVTRATAESVARRLFAGDTAIVASLIAKSILYCEKDICSLSSEALTLLQALDKPAAPAPISQFETLRQRVHLLRNEVESLQTIHDQSANQRTIVSVQLQAAKAAELTAAKLLQACEERLARAKIDHTRARTELLQVEQSLRSIAESPANLPTLRAALEAAEKEYRDFVAL